LTGKSEEIPEGGRDGACANGRRGVDKRVLSGMLSKGELQNGGQGKNERDCRTPASSRGMVCSGNVACAREGRFSEKREGGKMLKKVP